MCKNSIYFAPANFLRLCDVNIAHLLLLIKKENLEMNKRLFYYLFAVMCTVALFTSCSDDDNGSGDDQSVTDISGNYKGNLVVSIDGSPADPVFQVISIAKSGNQTSQVVLSLKDFSFAGQLVGDIEVPCVVVEKDGTQTFNGQKNLTFTTPFGQALGTLPTSVNGTVKDGKISMKIGVTVTLLGQVVDVNFDGNKMTGNESSEAKILSFTFDKGNAANSIVIGNAIINEDNTITFVASESATVEQLESLVPTIEVSEGATLKAPSTIDFSQDMVYTVISEDGATITTYTVKAPTKVKEPLMKYDFDTWEEVSGTSSFPNTKGYKWETPSPIDELATANEGIAALRTSLGGNYKGEYATVKEESGFGGNGHAVKLVTLDTRGVGSMVKAPAITPGSLYTGKFVFSIAGASDPLSLTKFGLKYYRKPLKLKGVYKYTPGTPFIDGSDKNNVQETGETDAPSINAVLYEAKDKDGNEVTLTGNDINSSDYRVAYATLKDGAAKKDWATFEEDFVYIEGKSYDATKEYKLAIVCSSSKEGDRFRGAANSTLIIDNLEVVGD